MSEAQRSATQTMPRFSANPIQGHGVAVTARQGEQVVSTAGPTIIGMPRAPRRPSSGLAKGRLWMEEIVHREHEEDTAARDSEVSNGDSEKAEDGVAHEQEGEPTAARRDGRLQHEPPSRSARRGTDRCRGK